jgi:hypothetical protein
MENIDLQSAVIALSKWTDWEPTNNFISLVPRIDSQDAWVFRSPVNQDVVNFSSFFLGTPKCDNRLASIFTNSGYQLFNPIFRFHAVELLSSSRGSGLYDLAGAPIGETVNVFLTDELPLQWKNVSK